MFNRIYVPIDNSDISDKVLQEAIKLAKSSTAKLRIAHVVNLEQITFGIEMVGVAELKDALLSIGQSLIDKVKLQLATAGVDAEVKINENSGSEMSA